MGTRMCWVCRGFRILSYFARDCFFFVFFVNETPRRPEVKRKLLPLGIIFCWESLKNSHEHFGFMLNYTVFEEQQANFYCINQVNSGRVRAVPETIVCHLASLNEPIYFAGFSRCLYLVGWPSTGQPGCMTALVGQPCLRVISARAPL